jgi:hypothetical protein
MTTAAGPVRLAGVFWLVGWHPAGIGPSGGLEWRTLRTLQEERMELAEKRTGLDVWLAW